MRVNIQNYKKSVNETFFTDKQIKTIWDFYVTKSVANSASQKRTINDYGKKQFPWKEMIRVAGIDVNDVKILCANNINKTLVNYGLCVEKKSNGYPEEIEIDDCKIICVTPFSISDEERPKPKCGDAESVLTHIRNSFAHGNTYFFDNGNVLFEDKDNRGTITARMLLKQQTLLDWIFLIDSERKYYDLSAEEA